MLSITLTLTSILRQRQRLPLNLRFGVPAGSTLSKGLLMNQTKRDIILSMIRHGLTLAAGALIAKGTLNEVGADQLTGAIMTIIGVLWGAADKVGREQS